jgi:hypothetical protein
MEVKRLDDHGGETVEKSTLDVSKLEERTCV